MREDAVSSGRALTYEAHMVDVSSWPWWPVQSGGIVGGTDSSLVLDHIEYDGVRGAVWSGLVFATGAGGGF